MAAGPLADATRALIDERCRLLAGVGFLVLTYIRTYELTKMGLRYLDGDLIPLFSGTGLLTGTARFWVDHSPK
jgi:hypothetical protein